MRGLVVLGRVSLLSCLLLLLFPPLHLQAQEAEPGLDAQVEVLISTMTIEERVGQLFLVAFVGNDPGPGTDIARLIRQDRVGGVVLLAANSNFRNDDSTPRQVAELTNGLQAQAMGEGVQVPLFIAVDHEGDGYPYTRITGGTTPLPNAMAIGAAWNVDYARDVGQITGLELAAMGVNLLLGPSVDVLHSPRPSGQGDIGTRSFGGDPWWVGQMGRAYIEGVHRGSDGRVATVAKHFPGHGGSDRLPDEEVATVDKSVEELRKVELAPFMAVTEEGSSASGETDALMSSHIRYRGFQRDIRQFTAPISFDAEGMGAILDLPEFASWRANGLMISDSLGVPAVRKYFDPTLGTFPHRRIAKESFLAGNDVLLLSQFDLNDVWADQYQNIRDTIAFFREEYRANPSFAARVDAAVARILRLKLRLYPEFTLEAVRVHPAAAIQVSGLGTEVSQRVANRSLTLLYPDANALPAAPRQGEKILILTDARPVRECFSDDCQPFSPLSLTAVEEAILRTYGPEGTNQVDPEDVTSLPFGQLKKYLSGEETQYDVSTLLQEAQWVLFAQQDLNLVKAPNSDTVRLFLNHPQSAAHQGKLVVLAFNAPYYLDTTEISKLSLYLGAYSKVEPFVEGTVRALFGELVPSGAPPVNVAGINYDLQHWLAPDPGQVIPFSLLEPASDIALHPPQTVRLQAGPILDRNRNPVSDGLPVTFLGEYADGSYAAPGTATTASGLAEATLTLNSPGPVWLRAESGEAAQSQVVEVMIQPLPTVTVAPSRTPVPMPTHTPTLAPSPTPTVTPSPVPTGGTQPPAASNPVPPVDGLDLLLASGAILIVAAAGFLLLRRRQPVIVVRWFLLAICGGMAIYVLYALQVIRPEAWGFLPDAAWVARAALIGLVALGALVPLAFVVGSKDLQS
jgi:beta-N-acetylhexosaminidase